MLEASYHRENSGSINLHDSTNSQYTVYTSTISKDPIRSALKAPTTIMEIVQIGLRTLQLLWIIILTALLGNVIATHNNGQLVSAAAVNFSMFVTVLSWLATLYGLAVAFASSLAIPIVVLAADGAAVLFTFIDAIVLAATLHVRNCGDEDGSLQKKCRELQASTAFMWFLLATFLGSLALAALAFRRGGGASVRSGPTMKQVHVGV